MNIIPSGQIDKAGFKRVLVHTGLIGLAAIAVYLVALAKGHDFGVYDPIATILIGFAVTFLEKFFSDYQVPFAATPSSGGVGASNTDIID